MSIGSLPALEAEVDALLRLAASRASAVLLAHLQNLKPMSGIALERRPALELF